MKRAKHESMCLSQKWFWFSCFGGVVFILGFRRKWTAVAFMLVINVFIWFVFSPTLILEISCSSWSMDRWNKVRGLIQKQEVTSLHNRKCIKLSNMKEKWRGGRELLLNTKIRGLSSEHFTSVCVQLKPPSFTLSTFTLCFLSGWIFVYGKNWIGLKCNLQSLLNPRFQSIRSRKR